MSGEFKEIIVSMTKEHVGIKINIQRVRKIELLEIKIMTAEMKKLINRRVGNQSGGYLPESIKKSKRQKIGEKR